MAQFLQAAIDEISSKLVEIIGNGITVEQTRELVQQPTTLDAEEDLTFHVNRTKRYKIPLPEGGIPAAADAWAKAYPCGGMVTKVVGSERGFILFFVDRAQVLPNVLRTVVAAGPRWGEGTKGAGKKVVVEYSSPNLGKPFHAGHLRSTIVGQFLVNVHKLLGYDTTAVNYLGDWGSQYSLLSLGFEKYGSEEKLQEDPMRHLYEIYVKMNADADADPSVRDAARAHFVRMEAGEEDALKHWRKFRELSIGNMKTVFERLNVEFDFYDGESRHDEGMKSVIAECNAVPGMVNVDQGAQLITFPEKKLGKVLLVKKDGTTLYFTRDLAAARARAEQFKFDQMMYVVGSQQDLHFKQVFKALNMLGHEWAKKLDHVGFGMVKGMSTRKGTSIFLKDILDESKTRSLELMSANGDKFKELENPEKVADIIGVSAVVIQDLGAKRIKGYEFKWDRIFDIGGKTGPYLQYAHARMCSIERKCGVKINPSADLSSLYTSTEDRAAAVAIKLTRVISMYADKVVDACDKREPNTIVMYLFDLSKAVNSANEVLKVKGMPDEIAEPRLLLFHAARITLGNGMRLLCLDPVERM